MMRWGQIILRVFAPLWLWVILCIAPMSAVAQSGPAVLVADNVWLSGNDRLIAEGNVEALQGSIRLQAQRITYLRGENRLIIDGPIRITDSDGTVILADRAELDQDLENGLLLGARLVMNQQLQLAALEMHRASGRYMQLSRAVVTACQVCGKDDVPLWQIRAKRVIHDQQERQLYFEGAQLRVADIPIAYLPRLRLPDPTLKRARGFLVPNFRNSTLLGVGIKLPYFIPIGDHRDLTVTPYISARTRTLELRYRQAFARGDIEFKGAVSRDELGSNTARAYLFGHGLFHLNRGYTLEFDIESVSDDSYLTEYGYASKDRLDSELALRRTSRHRHFEAALVQFHTLREDEDNATQPTIAAEAQWLRRYQPALIGGEARLSGELHSHYRYSNTDGDDGRDLARAHLVLDWDRRWTLPFGLRAAAKSRLAAEHFAITQDSNYPDGISRLTPSAAVELRWPWTRQDANGGTQLIEPMVQASWTGALGTRAANDESTHVEFDEANLLSLSRYPAADQRETGRATAVGLRWERHAPTGWNAGLTLGKIWRDTPDTGFSASSGLDGAESALLLAGFFRNRDGLALSARGLFAPDGDVAKAEARAAWSNQIVDLGATYVLLPEDTDENRNALISEWSLDGSYKFARHWTASADWRYDLGSDRTAVAGLGLGYSNECVDITLSARRRFTTTTNLEPSTDFGLTVALKGFSTGGAAEGYRRTCRN